MKFLARLILAFIANAIALWAASYLIAGFTISYDLYNFLIVTALLTLINLYLKPIVKMIFSPLIILSFGLFTLVINAALLWVLDIFSQNLTIDGLLPLVYATLIISFVNLIVHFSAKIVYKTTSQL
jgi:putative membrane protein